MPNKQDMGVQSTPNESPASRLLAYLTGTPPRGTEQLIQDIERFFVKKKKKLNEKSVRRREVASEREMSPLFSHLHL